MPVRQQYMSVPVPSNGPTIFCSMLTVPGSRDGLVKAAVKNWCSSCDACVLFSNVTSNGGSGAERSAAHFGATVVGLREDCRSRSHKEALRHMWTARHAKGFSFYFHADDDTSACVGNLRSFVSSLRSHEQLYMGRSVERMFNAGSSGYLLSAKTQLALGRAFKHGEKKCALDRGGRNPGDVFVANCLRTAVGVRPAVINASYTGRGGVSLQRFMPFERMRTVMVAAGDTAVIREFCSDPARISFGECDCTSKPTEMAKPAGWREEMMQTRPPRKGHPQPTEPLKALAWFCGLASNKANVLCVQEADRSKARRHSGDRAAARRAVDDMTDSWCSIDANAHSPYCLSRRDPSVCPT